MELKNDKYKNRLELIPTELIEEVGRVLTFGANKYAPNAWRKAREEDYGRFVGAAMRHLEAYRKGEYFDSESGLPHLAHAATNLGFLLALDKKNKHYAGANIAKLPTEREYVSEYQLDNYISTLAERIESEYVILLYIPEGGKHIAEKLASKIDGEVKILPLGEESIGDRNPAVYVVDDIVDTGRTLKANKALIGDYKVLTPVMRYSADVQGFEVLASIIVSHDKYIVFPWEVEDVENK